MFTSVNFESNIWTASKVFKVRTTEDPIPALEHLQKLRTVSVVIKLGSLLEAFQSTCSWSPANRDSLSSLSSVLIQAQENLRGTTE